MPTRRHAPTSGCQFCGRSFKRQDHLDRHELSHGEAQFRCNHPSCGMMFHRQDVLKRHQKVHQPDPVKRHRQPRRGLIPKSMMTFKPNSVPSTDEDTNATNIVSETPIGFLSIPSTIPQLDPFEFCLLHFKQACARRWSFLHHTSLHSHAVLPEMKLAMASLAGCSVPEYRQDALRFLQESRSLLSRKQQTEDISCRKVPTQLDTRSAPDEVLASLQTQVLLLECALWHGNADAKQWAFRTTFDLASTTVPKLIKQFAKADTDIAQQCWKDWIHEEEGIRALWTFYCVTQKAMQQFPCAISTFCRQRNLRLPQPDIMFDAADEATWSQSKQDCLANNLTLSGITLMSALQHLQSTSESHFYRNLASLTPIARHVVLTSLLEAFTSSTQVALSIFEGTCSHQPCTTSQNDNTTRFSQILQRAKSLWYVSPGYLFASSPACGTDLQNVLLLCHLETLVLTTYTSNQHRLPEDQVSLNLCATAGISADVLIATYENDMLEVATKVSWLLDAACKQFVVGLARKMVRWIEYLEQRGGVICLQIEHGHNLLHQRLCCFLRELDRGSDECERDLHDIRQFKEAVTNAWCAVLHCPFERWCAQQD